MGNWLGRDRTPEGPRAARKVRDIRSTGSIRLAGYDLAQHTGYTHAWLLVDICVQERPLPKTVGGIPVDWVEGDIAARQPNLEGGSASSLPSKSVAQSHTRQLQGCASLSRRQ
jgi:hypothetical protein